jgi:hypothetical protein
MPDARVFRHSKQRNEEEAMRKIVAILTQRSTASSKASGGPEEDASKSFTQRGWGHALRERRAVRQVVGETIAGAL